MSYEDHDC